jgi:FkbM family methyltransferase
MAYPDGTRVVAIEANTRLIPYLEKSRDMHPSRDHIMIHNVAAADCHKDAIPLFVDSNWSGTTTAIDKGSRSTSTETIHVPQRTVDSLLQQDLVRAGGVVFKLDVEGYEYFVLKGMQDTIAGAPSMIGYIEIDLNFLAETGATLAELDELLRAFELYWPTDKRSKRLRPIASLAALKALLGEGFHTDIIVVKQAGTAGDWLPASWRIEPA